MIFELRLRWFFEARCINKMAIFAWFYFDAEEDHRSPLLVPAYYLSAMYDLSDWGNRLAKIMAINSLIPCRFPRFIPLLFWQFLSITRVDSLSDLPYSKQTVANRKAIHQWKDCPLKVVKCEIKIIKVAKSHLLFRILIFTDCTAWRF